MNLITLTGNLGRDWEQANSNTVIAKNSLAVRRDFNSNDSFETNNSTEIDDSSLPF